VSQIEALTQAEAVVEAIRDLRASGGGSLWIHSADFEGEHAEAEACPCHPALVQVEGAQ
jgi:hypothetical protein